MNKFALFIALLFVSSVGFESFSQAVSKAKANDDTENFVYEIEGVDIGTQGTYLVKVWSYSKRPSVATEQAKKNAVHGVIFKGFVGRAGVPGQRPLTTNPNIEQEKKEFFDNFFADGGKYMKFVTVSGDGSVAAEDRMKVGKRYKIGVIVSVNVSELRKDLETAGIIRSLNSGF